MKDFEFISYYLDDPLVKGRVYDIFMPAGVREKTVLFMIHGGGWSAGSRTIYHELMQELCRRGFIVASTDYRLNVPAYDQLSDIRESYMHFCRFLEKRGIAPEIVAYGGSAGAHLASLLVCAAPGECGDKKIDNWIAPVGGMFQACPASFVPWYDIFPAVWSSMQKAAGVSYETSPETYRKLSLDHQIKPGNPPVFFLEAECEHMFWPWQKIELAEKMSAMGNKVKVKIYPRAEHGFIYSLERDQQKNAFEDIVRFLKHQDIENCAFCNVDGGAK